MYFTWSLNSSSLYAFKINKAITPDKLSPFVSIRNEDTSSNGAANNFADSASLLPEAATAEAQDAADICRCISTGVYCDRDTTIGSKC